MTISQLGLIAATHTPFHDDGELNLDLVAPLARQIAAAGASGAFVAGSTGEAHSLSMRERMELAEAWVDAAADLPLEVIIHVGHNCQKDAVELAAHARLIGAGAVAALSASYFKPAAVSNLVDFLQPVASAAGSLPFYYYHIPPMTGVRLPMIELLSEAARTMPNFRGLKYSDMDLAQMQRCIQFDEGCYDILFGCDESLLAGLALGIRGAVGSTYNFAAGLYLGMIEAFERGDLTAAQALQARSVEMVERMKSYGFLPASRVAMEMLGLEIGPARPPLSRLSEADKERLRRELAAMECLDPCHLTEIPAAAAASL